MWRRFFAFFMCIIILLSVFTIFKPLNLQKVLSKNDYHLNDYRANSFYELYNFLFDYSSVTKADTKLSGDDLKKIETFLDKADRNYKSSYNDVKLDSEKVTQRSYNIAGYQGNFSLYVFEFEYHHNKEYPKSYLLVPLCVCLKYSDGNFYYFSPSESKVGFSNGWIQDISANRIEFTYTQNREVIGTEDFMIKYLTSIDSQSQAYSQNKKYHNIEISTLYSAYLWLFQFKTLE